jgi:hypothetical protein
LTSEGIEMRFHLNEEKCKKRANEFINFKGYVPPIVSSSLRDIIGRDITSTFNDNSDYISMARMERAVMVDKINKSTTAEERRKASFVPYILSPYGFFEDHPEFADLVEFVGYNEDWELDYLAEKCPDWKNIAVKYKN